MVLDQRLHIDGVLLSFMWVFHDSFCWGVRLTPSDPLGFKPKIWVLWVRNPDLRFYNCQIDAFTKTRKRV
ncbi:hypothetical protein Hanom_Chr03g00211211 [Helianthus anomalus]